MKLDNNKAKKLKEDFPIFKNNEGLVYLDNAATTQKPKQVIDKIKDFYEKSNANIHRGVYDLSENATEEYEKSRKIVSEFINANEKEIIFTKGTTDSINFIAYTIDQIIPEDKNEIVLTEFEHHSNLIPWQQLAKRKNMKIKFVSMKDDFTLDLEDAKQKITDKTAIVAVSHVSNSLGVVNPIKEIIAYARKEGAITIVDAAQSAPHIKIDVKNLDCDFLAFSGHKMLAPFGIGVLYGKKELLEKLNPFTFGGGMIKSVHLEESEFAEVPEKFEAGTPNISGAIVFGEAISYLRKIGMDEVENWEKELLKYAYEKIKEIGGVDVYCNDENFSGILSFNVKGVHPHDVATILNDYKICVRAGTHCTMPLMKSLGISGTVRASFYIYNTFEDIDKFIEGIKKVKEKFVKWMKHSQINYTKNI